MPAIIANPAQISPSPEEAEEQLLKAVQSIDWEAHWREVIEIMSQEATAYEQARARSMEGAARRVFL